MKPGANRARLAPDPFRAHNAPVPDDAPHAPHAPIELAGAARPATPRLRGEVVLRPDTDAVTDALLADLYLHAQNCVRTFGDFQFAVSGVAALEPVLRRLLFDLPYRDFPWSRTRLWQTEELAVQADDPAARWPRLRDLIVEQSGIPPEQAHAVGDIDPAAAARYADVLRNVLEWRAKGHDRPDFVLLHLDPSGAVGALAPDVRDEDLCAATTLDAVPAVTLSPRIINASRCVAVLATGEPSLAPLRAIEAALRANRADRSLPGLMLAPTGGDLRWYLDFAACPASRRSA